MRCRSNPRSRRFRSTHLLPRARVIRATDSLRGCSRRAVSRTPSKATMLNQLLGSIEILGGVGLVFAIIIALAYWKLRVWEDPRVDAVASMLPGANCGACGSPGCRGFAERVVAG